jgi:competence protein ComEC
VRERPWHVSLATVALGLLLAGSPSGLAIAAAALLACLLTGQRAPRLGAAGAALLLAATAVGDVRLESIDASAKRVRDGERVALRAWLLTAPRPGRFGSSAEARAVSGPLRGARLLLRIPRWSPLPRGVRVGNELMIAGSLRAIHVDREPGGDGGFDFDSYLRRRGFAAELLLDAALATGRRRAGAAGALDAMRARAERGVTAGMSARAGPLLRGMVLGEDEAIAADVREDFRASGLAHLLAVSGQNVMLLAALAVPLLALAGLGLRARLLGLVLLIALYVPLAGAGPALQRAGAMGTAGIVATALSRPASGVYALLLAAVATLLANRGSQAIRAGSSRSPPWPASCWSRPRFVRVCGAPPKRSFRRRPTSRARRGIRLFAS